MWLWLVLAPYVTHEVLVDAPRSLFHIHVAPKQGFESLQQQWMALLALHHLVGSSERVPPKSGIWLIRGYDRNAITVSLSCFELW